MKIKFAKILIAALAVAFVGCNHSDDDYTPAPAGIKVRVEAGTSSSTRTEFNGTQTTWSVRDEINVAAFNVGGAEKLTEAVLTTQSSAVEAIFDGTITEGQYNKIPRGETYDYVAAYPSSAEIAQDGKSVSFAVPASYTATPNSLNGHLFDFMVATATNCASIAVTDAATDYPEFGFEHVLAFLEITLTGNDPIQTVKVTAPAAICGTVSVDPTKDDLTPTVSGGSNTINVNINGTLNNGEKLYVPVIPGVEHTGDLTITLTCKNGDTHTITKTLNSKTFVRGQVTRVNGIGYTEGVLDVKSYVENNESGVVTDVNGLSVSATFENLAFDPSEVTFYWSASPDGEGSVIEDAKSVNGNTATLSTANSEWNDKDIYVWAVVNRSGNEIASTARTPIYIIGSGDVLTSSAYTSYSKYIDPNAGAEVANTYNAYTIYDVKYKENKKNVPEPDRVILEKFKTTVTFPNGTEANVTTYEDLQNLTLVGAYLIKGEITIGGKRFTAERTVYITGLPYSIDFYNKGKGSMDIPNNAGWTCTNMGYVNTGLTKKFRSTESDAWISKEFYLPNSSSITISTWIEMDSYGSSSSWFGNNPYTTFTMGTSTSASAPTSDKVTFEDEKNLETKYVSDQTTKDMTMSNSFFGVQMSNANCYIYALKLSYR